MDQVQGKHFSITDPQNVNTVIYQINKTEGLMEMAHVIAGDCNN